MITKLDLTDLAVVNGGMNMDGWRPSENVEDRTGMTLEQSMNAPTPKVDPLPPLVRTPGDLSSQAGLDDIGRTFGGNDGGNFGF